MSHNFYAQATFLTSAAKVSQLPEDTGYEIAFAGRSNAGKSSALNCLTRQKNLARTSKTPGRTQLINLFALDPTRRLVDLPGYGYAKVAVSVKEAWQKNLSHYLQARDCLRGLVLVMDSRHPLKDLDCTMIDWCIGNHLPIHLLLTKADKLSKSEINNTLCKVEKQYALMPELVSVQAFSSLKKAGLDSLIARLNTWLELS